MCYGVDLQIIQSKIYEIRGQRVMLDFDLAELYGTETKVLKQSVKRNIRRFPSDFMFELTKEEFELLRSQIEVNPVQTLGFTSIWNLRSWQRKVHKIFTLCFYRTGISYAFRYIKLGYSYTGKY